jgi:hypothetical protein
MISKNLNKHTKVVQVQKEGIKAYWLIYPLLIIGSIMIFAFGYRFIQEKLTYESHINVFVFVEDYSFNSSKSESPYTVKFTYLSKKYTKGVWRKTFRGMNKEGEIELLYNKELDYFIDKNLTSKKINTNLFFVLLGLILEFYLLYGLITGKYKRWF